MSKADASGSKNNGVNQIRWLDQRLPVDAALIRCYTPILYPQTCLIKSTGVLFGLQATPLVRKNSYPMVLVGKENFYVHSRASRQTVN
jgi:hypothetical protein